MENPMNMNNVFQEVYYNLAQVRICLNFPLI